MRIWGVNPKLLCNKHLLGEHVESHMFRGSIIKNKSIRGFIDKGLVEIHNLKIRHDALATEMIERNINHKSEFLEFETWNEGTINIKDNLEELKKRCSKCCFNILQDENFKI